jgi:hypothetical protein
MEADDLPSVPGPNDLLNQQKFYGVYEAATNAGETLLSVLQRDWIPRITSCYNSLSGFVPADALSLVLTEAANPQSQILADKVTLIYDYDIVLASYTDWVQPDNTFSLSMSETTQTAILNSLTEGLEASVGLSAFGFSASLKASISSTSSTTYTTISGKTVTQTWNLRDFDQNYVYKVVLVGRVKTVRQDPTIYGYYNAVLYNTPVDTAWVDQNSLTMKLVRRPR